MEKTDTMMIMRSRDATVSSTTVIPSSAVKAVSQPTDHPAGSSSQRVTS